MPAIANTPAFAIGVSRGIGRARRSGSARHSPLSSRADGAELITESEKLGVL